MTEIIDIINNINDQIYNNRPLAIELYKKGFLPNKNYFEYEIEKTLKFQNNFKKNFSKRLKELNINEEEFIATLKSFNGTISGSFVLQCLLDEYWSSDIDMYISYANAMLFKDPTNIYKTFDTENNKVTLIKSQEKDFKKYEDILGLDKFKINKLEIDLVWIKGDYEPYIYEKYDFDFCKNYYDGDNVYVHDWNAVIDKKSFSKKYTKNNKIFTIIKNNQYDQNECMFNDTNIKDIEMQINYKYIERIKKYQKRGFKIYTSITHNDKLNILSFENMNKKICEFYFQKCNYDDLDYNLISEDIYNEIIDIFQEGKEQTKCIKNVNNDIKNENLKMLLDIYENGLDKYFYKMLFEKDFYDQIESYGFLPDIKYDLYLSQNMFSVYIINDKLKEQGIKSIIDKYKGYIIYGDFINHCLYGSGYDDIYIIFTREEDSNIYIEFDNFKNIKIHFHNITNKRTLLSLINLNMEYKYYFDGEKIATF